MGYFKATLRGISWMGALRAATRLTAFVRIAILARILVPDQFGSYGIALLVLGFLEIITESGINLVLIQEKKDIDKFIDTAWVFSILRGFLISIIIIFVARLISTFFNLSDAYNLLLLTALVPAVRGFINPSIVKLQKELMFSKEFFYRFSIFFVDSAVAIALALITKNPTSLILGLVAGALYEVVFTFLAVSPRPRFLFDFRKVKYIIKRGKWVTGFAVFDYLYTQGDNAVVGKILGAYSLGIYQNAYKISLLPLTEFGDVLYKVTVPVFVKISSEKERLKRAFIKNVLGTLGLVIPAGILIFLFSKEVVLIILGNNWTQAIPVFRILVFLGIIRGVANSTNSLFVSTQNQKFVTITTFVSALTLIVTIVPLVYTFGVLGAAYSAILGTVFAIPFNLYFVRKLLFEK